MKTPEEYEAEIERLKTRVVVTEWRWPGATKLILKGTVEETREEARQFHDDSALEEDHSVAHQRMMTNAELETLPEWEP